MMIWTILIQHRGKLMQNDEMYWRILPFINSIKEDHIAIQITETISNAPSGS
jgi:hypothetical protein